MLLSPEDSSLGEGKPFASPKERPRQVHYKVIIGTRLGIGIAATTFRKQQMEERREQFECSFCGKKSNLERRSGT
jgi:hypothetical protein